jgi:hypothetical protein
MMNPANTLPSFQQMIRDWTDIKRNRYEYYKIKLLQNNLYGSGLDESEIAEFDHVYDQESEENGYRQLPINFNRDMPF